MGLLTVGCATTAPVVTAPTGATDASAWRPVFTASDSDVFIRFDARALAPGQAPTSVTLVGTFNSWGKAPGEPPSLQRRADGTWGERFPRARLDVPGNSGTTEFQFILDGHERVGGGAAPEGQRFGNNFVILWPGITADTLARREAQNRVHKTHYDSAAELTNFRALAGGQLAPGRLYRSYHPFIPSRQESAETARLEGVQRLMEENHIAAVINLSDDAEVLATHPPSAYYQRLMGQGRVLLAPTHYNVVYFGSAEPAFSAELEQILTFIANTPGPYLVHCRLGTDRTGVVSAVLQALAGVPWATILADFQQSNSLGIREYRAPELLTYSLTRFLDRSPDSYPPGALATAVRIRLEQKGIRPELVARAVAALTP